MKQNILVTGASSGFGLLIANKLHESGHNAGAEFSRRVAERLGFTLEGIRRESHWITDRFVDHAVYGMLRREWRR